MEITNYCKSHFENVEILVYKKGLEYDRMLNKASVKLARKICYDRCRLLNASSFEMITACIKVIYNDTLTEVTIEGSCKPEHVHRLTRVFAVQTHDMSFITRKPVIGFLTRFDTNRAV